MVRPYPNTHGSFVLYGSDLEHSVTTPIATAINDYLNGLKTSVDSSFRKSSFPWIHTGIRTSMNTDLTATAGSFDIMTGTGGQIPYGYSSIYDDFADGIPSSTLWGSSLDATGTLTESGGTLILNQSDGTNDPSVTQTYTSTIEASQMSLGIGSVVYVDASFFLDISSGANHTARYNFSLYDGSSTKDIQSNIITSATTVNEAFSGAVKIIDSSTARIYSFIDGTQSDIDISSLTLPVRIRFLAREDEGPGGGGGLDFVSTSITIRDVAFANANTSNYFQTGGNTPSVATKSAALWANVYTIDDNNNIVQKDIVTYRVSTNEGFSFPRDTYNGIETYTAFIKEGVTDIRYQIDLNVTAGSPIWLDSWGAVYDYGGVLN